VLEDVVVRKVMFAISSPDEFLVQTVVQKLYLWAYTGTVSSFVLTTDLLSSACTVLVPFRIYAELARDVTILCYK